MEHQDLGPASKQDRSETTYGNFSKYLEEEICHPKKKRSLWRVLIRTCGYYQFSLAIFYYGVYTACSFGPILILNALVKNFEGTDVLPTSTLWILVAFIFVIPMVGSIIAARSNVMFARFGLIFRNVLINKIYRKSLLLSPAARQASSSGQIVNMFSNDTAQIQRFMLFVNNCVLAVPTIAVCLYLIYTQVGPATFVGLALIIVIVPMNGCIFNLLNIVRRKKTVVTDRRVKLMNEILNGIRVIKYYAWEDAFSDKIEDIRTKELVYLKQSAYIIAVGFTVLLMAVPIFLPVLIFFTYSKLGNQLTAAKAFTSISLFNLMQFPFVFLPLGIIKLSYILC